MMLRTTLISAAGFLLVTAAAVIAQPYSTSLAQCAGLYQNLAQYMDTEYKLDQALTMTHRFHAASVAQAKAEGIADADAKMTDIMDSQTAEWEAEGGQWFRSEEFKDWASYCRKFGKAQGIDMNPRSG